MKSINREDRVKEFLDCARPPTRELATSLISEEYRELIEAVVMDNILKSEVSRANLVKEWADLQYVLSQFAVVYDIDGDAAFNRVADNNMTKVQDGEVVYREDGKIMKPEGYQKPDMRGL